MGCIYPGLICLHNNLCSYLPWWFDLFTLDMILQDGAKITLPTMKDIKEWLDDMTNDDSFFTEGIMEEDVGTGVCGGASVRSCMIIL